MVQPIWLWCNHYKWCSQYGYDVTITNGRQYGYNVTITNGAANMAMV